MTLQNTTQKGTPAVSEELRQKVDDIVAKANKSTFLWRLAVIEQIKFLLADKFSYGRVVQRLIFGTSINGNQVFFGSLVHYGKRVILFVPSVGHLMHLSFVEVKKSEFSGAIVVTSKSFSTSTNTYFVLQLGSHHVHPPHRLQVITEGDSTFLDVPDAQGQFLYDWFATILSSQQ